MRIASLPIRKGEEKPATLVLEHCQELEGATFQTGPLIPFQIGVLGSAKGSSGTVNRIARNQAPEVGLQSRVIFAINQQPISSIGGLVAHSKAGHCLEDGAVRGSSLKKIGSEGIGIDTSIAKIASFLDLRYIGTGQ
ncbi:hypothetical protein D3C77_605050 [compost metagenome]